MKIQIEISTRDVVFAVWERVALALWRGRTTVAALRQGQRIFEDHALRCDNRLLLLTVIEEHAPLPPLEARMELVTSLKHGNGRLERSALVFEGDGFRASSVRAVVAGISLFSRPEYPHRVFSSVAPAARFLGGGKIDAPTPARVIQMVNEGRRTPGSATLVTGSNQSQTPEARPR